MGIDKIGRPVYIEQVGKVKPDKLLQIIDEDEFSKAWYRSYEEVQKLHFMACSFIK